MIQWNQCIQNETSHPSLQRRQWCHTKSESQHGTWRIQQVVKLAAVSYDDVNEIGNSASDFAANIEKKHEPSYQPK